MKEIEFGLIVRGSLVAEVKDVGTFSPGAEIKHKFGVSKNIFPIQTSYAKCVPLHILFVDGTKWKNPHLPAYRASMYGAPRYVKDQERRTWLKISRQFNRKRTFGRWLSSSSMK